mmetsp:Transcript_20956/g.58302  ORF Transcript_20956/g.58302 Transcript_20956/m.58302 type:complete len:223 (-) Transcript_20956:280-948(-)
MRARHQQIGFGACQRGIGVADAALLAFLVDDRKCFVQQNVGFVAAIQVEEDHGVQERVGRTVNVGAADGSQDLLSFDVPLFDGEFVTVVVACVVRPRVDEVGMLPQIQRSAPRQVARVSADAEPKHLHDEAPVPDPEKGLLSAGEPRRHDGHSSHAEHIKQERLQDAKSKQREIDDTVGLHQPYHHQDVRRQQEGRKCKCPHGHVSDTESGIINVQGLGRSR